ncbi:MAG: hypothetical protein RE471_01465 [Ferroplasma sp.]|uniref:hypothetical protein n=1 Tax=Ferroplasma sp. TaxID=2591003 RepID=UPI002816395D|nr:hypothetical protein [Ferroplasma sp.]WMT51564.1 MAG: hypothetical protein RE471_01465 [Ferroplasma sp.]
MVQSSPQLEAGYDVAGPFYFILSGHSMTHRIEWYVVANMVEKALSAAFLDGKIPEI